MGEFEAPEFDAVEPIDFAKLADGDFALGKAETEELDSLVERESAPGAEGLLAAEKLHFILREFVPRAISAETASLGQLLGVIASHLDELGRSTCELSNSH